MLKLGLKKLQTADYKAKAATKVQKELLKEEAASQQVKREQVRKLEEQKT